MNDRRTRANLWFYPVGPMMTAKFDPYSYPPRGMSRDEAARYVGVGTTKFDEMVVDERMPKPKRIDGRTVWDRIAIYAAFSELPSEGGNRMDDIMNRAREGKRRV